MIPFATVSSLIASFLAEINSNSQVFTLANKSDTSIDESGAASKLCQFYGLNHSVVDSADIPNSSIEDYFCLLDHPTGDCASFSYFAILLHLPNFSW